MENELVVVTNSVHVLSKTSMYCAAKMSVEVSILTS